LTANLSAEIAGIQSGSGRDLTSRVSNLFNICVGQQRALVGPGGLYTMNWDQIEGKWKQMKGSMKQKWGQLTDSDFDQIAGQREKFVGRLQERYGYTREQAQNEIDQWMKTQHAETDQPKIKMGGSGH
jgi:uncharacterized protein YjbJ (UPF0337 family)